MTQKKNESRMGGKISLVTPFFDEEDSIPVFHGRMLALAASLPLYEFEFVCVDDGSRDSTPDMLSDMAEDPRFVFVRLSRNFGKEAALSAGLAQATGDAVIPLDADLQDPPELIPEMLLKWQEGFDCVLARRIDRSEDSFLKRTSAAAFYKIHNMLADVRIPENVGDFRLLDRKVVSAVLSLPESQRFMKGLFSWVGFSSTEINYARPKREKGTTKFSGMKLWRFAIDGITSFSTVPLRVWTYLGATGALLSLLYAAFIFVRTLYYGVETPGYASLIVVILFLGHVQLLSVGILGEYIGRIFMESKKRPLFVVESVKRKKCAAPFTKVPEDGS